MTDHEPDPADRAAIVALMRTYFDGLYHSDSKRLREVLHPRALYATASDGSLLVRTMDDYWSVVDARPSPASDRPINDRIISIVLHGPVTALVTATCSMLSRDYVDVLTLLKVEGRWWIFSKVFHYDAI